MNAIISGSAGVAVIVEGRNLFSIDIDALDACVPRLPHELRFLFGDARDQWFVEGLNRDEARRLLEQEWNRAESLAVTLVLLNDNVPEQTRLQAALDLEAILRASPATERLEAVLYARPLPASVDAGAARDLCAVASAHIVLALLDRLQARQPAIRGVAQAFAHVPEAVFGGDEAHAISQATLVREGVFRELAIARASGQSVAGAAAVALQRPGVRSIKNHRAIITAWAKPLADVRKVPLEMVLDAPTTPASERGNSKSRPPAPVDRAKVLENVQSQKRLIVTAIEQQDIPRVDALVDALVQYQSKNGEPIHAAKSLCDLAGQAQRRGSYELQVHLLRRATQLRIDDAWSWAQLGKALQNVHNYREALSAYDNARQYGHGVTAENGRAEVLKAMGDLPAALTAYDETLKAHPANGVAKNGRAEVLKAMGDLPTALAAYDQALEAHPASAFAKTGRAEVLKAMGDLPAALAAYDQALKAHPSDGVAKTGRAGVLKAMGDLPAALAAYDQALKAHPSDVFAKTGRAEVLKAMGDLRAALMGYDEARKAHPSDVVAKTGRAEVLRAMGDLPAAFAGYEEAVIAHPLDKVTRNGRAHVLAAMGRWEEALQALAHVLPAAEEDWIGYHIRGMTLLRSGRLEAAARILEHAARDNPFAASRDYARAGLAVVRLRGRHYPSALELLEQVILPSFQAPANLLRIHALGFQGDASRVAATYALLPMQGIPVYLNIRDELRRRFIDGESPKHDEDWLIDQEIELLAAA